MELMDIEQFGPIWRAFGPSPDEHYCIRPLQYDDHVQALELILCEIYRNPEFFGLGGSVAVQNYLKYVKFVQRNLWHGCRSTKKVCILISLGIFLKHEIRCNIEFIENMLILREKYARSCKITFIGQAFSGEEIQEMAEKLKYRDLRPSKVEITTQNAEDYGLGHLRGTDMLPIKLLGVTLMTSDENERPISDEQLLPEPEPSTSYSNIQ